MRVPGPVTPTFVHTVEMPALCHVQPGGATLKTCESFAVCRTRLSLPYVLRSTSSLRQRDKGMPDAKNGLTGAKRRSGIESRCSVRTAPTQVVHRARQTFHYGERGSSEAALGVTVGDEVLPHLP